MFDVKHYETAAGVDIIARWIASLRDRQAVARVLARIDRLTVGNFGDCEPVGAGVSELRIDWGPGYRVCFGRVGQTVVLLLCGGDKKIQQRDINDAKAYFEDYKARTIHSRPSHSRKGRHPRKRIP